MEAKLIKVLEHYHLYDGDKAIATTIVGNPMLLPNLSLKNCQAIERGYDLDELAKTEYPIGEVWNDEEALIRELAFKKGFQKALEILGDKKFTEEDVLALLSDYGYDLTYADNLFEGMPKEWLEQSLQQNEWDVEIEMELIGRVKLGIGSKTEQMMPKLDADGCLILKLK